MDFLLKIGWVLRIAAEFWVADNEFERYMKKGHYYQIMDNVSVKPRHQVFGVI